MRRHDSARALALLLGLIVATSASVGQVLRVASDDASSQGDATAERDFSLELQTFYQDPQPNRVERLINRAETVLAPLDRATQDGAVAFMHGWLAVAFARWPERLPEWITPTRDPLIVRVIAWSLALAGHRPEAREVGRRAGLDEATLARLDRQPAEFEARVPKRAIDLDRLWGAAFASGDGRYVRPIIGLLNEDLGTDHAGRVVALMTRDPDKVKAALAGKSPAEAQHAALHMAALWGLISNGRRHAFVLEELRQGAELPLTSHGKLLIGLAVVQATERWEPL